MALRRPDGAPGLLVVPPGTDPARSLGWQLVDWYERMLVHGPGDIEGEPIKLDDELVMFVVLAYALDEHGRRLVHRAVLSRAKGRAKSELAGMVGCGEALGPVRFSHWARPGEVSWWGYRYQPGEPVGRPVRSPMLRCLATEEGQAGNTYDNVRFMLERGDIAGQVGGIDVGLTRTFLPGSGEVRPCTAGSASKDGGKESWACADETHLYLLPELVRMHDTVTRNLTKRRIAEPWMLETTTAFVENQESVAEASMGYARKIADGHIRNRGLLFDHRSGDISDEDFADDDRMLEALRQSYGPAAEWMDLHRILSEIRDPKTRPGDARRFFLNQPVRADAHQSWLPDGAWLGCAAGPHRPWLGLRDDLPTWVALDMALKHDSVAVIAVQLDEVGRWQVAHCIWLPNGDLVDVAGVEQHLRDLHRRTRLMEVAYDPAYFQRSAESLADDGLPMVEFPQTGARMVPACQTAYELICAGDVVHDGSPVLFDQVTSATARPAGEGWRLSKGKARRKIDAAIALVMVLHRATARPEPAKSDGFAIVL